MTKTELKPIDITRYTITENGNVIRSKTTNKELKQRAEEYAYEKWTDYPEKQEIAEQAYIAGATEETKELEKQIEKIKSDVLSLIKDRMNDDIDQNIIERLAEKWEIKEK